jgi:putative DNA methylase
MRALDYRQAPFELAVTYGGQRKTGRKVVGVSPPMNGSIVDHYPSGGLKPGSLYLSCGDSSKMDLPDKCVDAIVTDPPFFDNVHYSELADFFFVWQRLYFSDGWPNDKGTSRSNAEVQDTDANTFASKLRLVFAECRRVLRDEGLLVFSYHHSREDGWTALAQAVLGAGFSIVQSQPVKAEMSVAAPKSQAKEPIDLDVLVVCRKRGWDRRARRELDEAWRNAIAASDERIRRFNQVGRRLSRNDVRVVLLSQLLVELSPRRTAADVVSAVVSLLPVTRDVIESIWREQRIQVPSALVTPQPGPVQLPLLEPVAICGTEAGSDPAGPSEPHASTALEMDRKGR